jgi:hypothetical protein
MPKTDLKATVAKLAEVARKTGGVFVFATRDANLPRGENVSAEIAEYPFAEHTCKECATVFSAVKAEGLQNHCITCGTDKVVANEISKPSIPQDSELSYLTCAACGTHNCFATAIGKEVASALCCTACGTNLHFTTASEEFMDSDDDTLDVDDMELLDLDGDSDVDEVEVSEKTGGDTPTAPAAPLDTGTPNTGKPPESTQEDTPSKEGNLVSPSNQDQRVEVPVDSKESATNADDTKPTDPKPAADESGTEPGVEMDMMDTCAESTEALTFAYVGNKVCLLSGVKIVATLSSEDAGDNADMLQTESFRQAVAHTINSKGLKVAASHYGFKSVKVSVPVKAMIDKAVASATEEKNKQVTASLDSEQFQHATDIAAAGYAGNFWRNKSDPVKAALIKELEATGMSNATKLVDRVFAAHGVAQLRDVLALARELSTKPAEALNGLAQAINLSKYQPTVLASEDEGDDDTDDEDDEDSDEESTVTTVATAIDDEPFKQTAGTIQYKDKSIAAILKGKPIF